MPDADVALIVTTYQMPGHLQRALASIACQRTDRRLEVIVTDDGSQDATAQVVADYSKRVPFSVRFMTGEHAGFRPAHCRNAGVRNSTAPHLLFFDGDCVLPPNHVEVHLRAARLGTVTSGYCVRLDEQTTRHVSCESIVRGDFLAAAPQDELKKLAALHRKAWWYNLLRHRTKPALKSTDFSLARVDFERVNGFDEQFEGWGCEDDDLGRRLMAVGIRPVSVLDRTRVYHLWHPPAPSKPAEWRQGANVAYLQRPIRLTRCLQGLAPRSPLDLTVRLAGEKYHWAALARLIRAYGWRIQSDSAERADIELLAGPGGGSFRGQGDCRVFAALDETGRLPWQARRAHIVLSPSGALGRPNQLCLRLADVDRLWQALLARPVTPVPTSRTAAPHRERATAPFRPLPAAR